MKRVKVAIGALGMLCMVPFFMKQLYSNNELQAAGTSFSLYEKVYLANDIYTIIGTDGSNVKLLKDSTIGTAQTWGDANNTLRNYPSDNSLGYLGQMTFGYYLSMPLSTDLTPITSANQLNTNVPAVGGDWWLGDGTVDNRNKFMTSDNKDNGSNAISSASQDEKTSACSHVISYEHGVKVAETKKDTDLTMQLNNGTEITVHHKASPSVDYSLYSSKDCKGEEKGVADGMDPGFQEIFQIYDSTYISISTTSLNSPYGAGSHLINAWLANGLFELKKDYTRSGNINATKCYALTTPIVYDAKDKDSIEIWSWKVKNNSGTLEKVSHTTTITALKNSVSITRTCTGATNTSGTALIRPMVTLPVSSIAFANSAKRTFTPANTLSGSFPSSDAGTNKPFVTLLVPSMGVWLDNAAGVSGNTYTVEMPSTGIIDLPLGMNTSPDGESYISASADINGETKYGVLKKVTGNARDTIALDLHKFADDPTTLSQINLKLYLEVSGQYNTSYISNARDITINLTQPKADQKISFATDNPTSAEYGSLTTIKAQLDTLTAKQSSKDIKFSIISGNATIDSQSYNSTTGIATAFIKPTSGTGDVVIAIDKDGDTIASAATRQTMTLTLDKKDIKATPTRFTKTYLLDEVMPALSSVSNDLANGDTLPSMLVPILEAMDGSNTSPSTDGIITKIGKWKQIYSATVLDALPTDFTNKYNITLEDWDDDNTYILQTSLHAIPEGWLIVTPDGNDAGWNHENVTISLSQEAKNMGYDLIEEIKQTGDEVIVVNSGETLLYSSEVSSKIPHVRITDKAQSKISEAMDIRELKIDKTDPVISKVTVDKKDDWVIGQKKISVDANDALSGIKEITATCGDKTYTATLQNSVYSFDADQNGTYTITVTDLADNTSTIT